MRPLGSDVNREVVRELIITRYWQSAPRPAPSFGAAQDTSAMDNSRKTGIRSYDLLRVVDERIIAKSLIDQQ
jgi:hypothetical protein